MVTFDSQQFYGAQCHYKHLVLELQMSSSTRTIEFFKFNVLSFTVEIFNFLLSCFDTSYILRARPHTSLNITIAVLNTHPGDIPGQLKSSNGFLDLFIRILKLVLGVYRFHSSHVV